MQPLKTDRETAVTNLQQGSAGTRASSVVWLQVYAVDRRLHRHRCRVCRRIVTVGERVHMARVEQHKTWVMHELCAATTTPEGVTHLALLECNGYQFLARLGRSDAREWLDASPLTKVRSFSSGSGEKA